MAYDDYDDAPDFDDLIDDDMEEPPDVEDDAALEDMMMADEEGEKVKETENPNNNKEAIVEPASAEKESDMHIDDEDDEDEDEDEDEAELHRQQGTTSSSTNWSSRSSRSPLRPTMDPFSFERYTHGVRWRRGGSNQVGDGGDDVDNNDMATRRVKTGGFHSMNGASSSRLSTARKSTSAEAQLLGFLEQRHKCRTDAAAGAIRINSSSMTTRPLPGHLSVSMTLAGDQRVYCAVTKTVPQPKTLVGGSSCRHSSSSYLLGESMTSLIGRVRRIRLHKEVTLREERKTPAASVNLHDNRQWVDKHAPNGFTHLLSDQRTNREVLRALRAWDPYVFRREQPARPERSFQNGSETQTAAADTNQWKGAATTRAAHDKRPEESARVILLSGPPGVGKSTMAHIVARHAGYRPLEVNGSDERSATVLKEHVLRAMESSTLQMTTGAAAKPNCIILDEIDGADAKGAIQSLVEIIRAEMPPKSSSGGSQPKKKPKGFSTPYLRRPIIFICNNKYAPALRPLLPYARHFNVLPPQSNHRLVTRLREILSAERISLSGGNSLLNRLVASTGGDIRSCLYTLQFASSSARVQAAVVKDNNNDSSKNGHDSASQMDISKALVSSLSGDGMKDERNDVSGTISKVFQKEKRGRIPGETSSNQTVDRPSADRVFDAVQRFGDNSKMLDFLFLNIPRVSYIDPTLDRCAAAHEWLSSSDLYRAHNHGISMRDPSDLYAMESLHIPAAAGAAHLLCRVEQKQDLTFTSREFADARYLIEANAAFVQKFVDGLPPNVGASRCLSKVASELIPYALAMLSAGEGSAALQRAATSVELLNKGEREAFDAHVEILKTLGLSYVASRDEASLGDGRNPAMTMRLEPPIDKVSLFGGNKNRQEVSVAMKELISRALVHEKLKSRRANMNSSSTVGKMFGVTRDQEQSTESNKVDVSKKRDSGAVRGAGPPLKRTKQITTTAVDFLSIGAKKAKEARSARNAARVGVQRANRNRKSHTGSGVRLECVVRLKHVKGFTQAVRAPCRVEDLICRGKILLNRLYSIVLPSTKRKYVPVLFPRRKTFHFLYEHQ